MKKQQARPQLKLPRMKVETIRVLSNDVLEQVQGGVSATNCHTKECETNWC